MSQDSNRVPEVRKLVSGDLRMSGDIGYSYSVDLAGYRPRTNVRHCGHRGRDHDSVYGRGPGSGIEDI